MRTSESDPLRVPWVPDLPAVGALGLTLAPGKHGPSSYHPVGWARDLDAGLEVRHFPIADDSVPPPRRDDAFAELVAGIRRALDDGRCVVVHCRGGVGRGGDGSRSMGSSSGSKRGAAAERRRGWGPAR